MKKKVKFALKDGLRPKRSPAKAFTLLSPIAVKLYPGAEFRLRLGLSCDRPLQVFQTRGLRERGIVLTNPGCWDEGSEIEVHLVSEMGPNPLDIEQGEAIARAVVLDNSDVEGE